MCGGRKVGGLLAGAVLVFMAAPLQGQRLLSLIPQATQPATLGAPDETLDIPRFAAQVDLDLLRSAPPRLELPTPDGRVLVAELSVFEDRGGGDLMWSGGLPEAGYDSVVLTLEGGRLVGWFGEPGGARYRISSQSDGRGRMSGGFGVPGQVPEAFCPVGGSADLRALPVAPGPAGAATVDPPARVAAAQDHDVLDILVVYTLEAALNWANRGGAQAAIRSAGDYLNMVLRNGRVGMSANIVHIAQISGTIERVGRDGVGLYGSSILTQLRYNGEALRLRREYGADLVHLFTGESPWLFGACGQHHVLGRDESAEEFSEYAYGWTSNACYDDGPIFAHEVGHGLGAHHDPVNGGSPAFAVKPYAFGHGNHDHIPNVGTIMSYTGQGEPYLSSVRIRPQGRVIGIAGERENERALQETIHIGVEYGDSVPRLAADAPAAPTYLLVTMASATSVRLTWRDNARDADGYEVTFGRSPASETSRAVEGRTGAVLDLAVADSGTRYFFRVNATRGESRSADSSTVTLVTPGAEPAAPSGLAWQQVAVDDPARMGTNSARVTWVDTSDDEYFFEVQLLAGGRLIRRKLEPSDAESTLIARLQPGVSYGVRVYSLGPGGVSSASETLTIESPALPGPRAVSNLTARGVGRTSVRLSWTDNSADELGFQVLALVSGWFGLFEAEANSEWIEIHGLARGGSYVFLVWPYDDAGLGGGSSAGLTLGATGRGPTASGRLAWAVSDGVARLNWVHNSSGEMGFEIQSRPDYESQDTTVVGGERWTRVALVPAGSTSFDLDRSEEVDYRVFAYDATGFSVSSNTVRGMPFDGGDGPAPEDGDGTLTAKTVSETSVELTWTGRWARAARGTLGIEARNPAGGWVEVATAVATMAGAVVEGLEAETPYTFRLRAGLTGAAADYSEEASATTGAYTGACREGSEYLCLRDGRFEVRAHWSKPDDDAGYGAGAAVPVDISDESGLFWFFEPENIELVVKVLDGRTINGSYWVFFGALSDVEYWITVRDATGGERQTYHNPPGEVCGQKDLLAFSDATVTSRRQAAGGLGPGGPGIDLLRLNAVPLDVDGVGRASHGGGHCEAGDYRLCLLDGRFSIEVGFVDPNGDTGLQEPAKVISSLAMEKTGFFWFFSPSNIELAVKTLDGRGLNGKFWLLYGGLSDVEYEITVTDTVTGSAKTYRNEAGNICGVIDTDAF